MHKQFGVTRFVNRIILKFRIHDRASKFQQLAQEKDLVQRMRTEDEIRQ